MSLHGRSLSLAVLSLYAVFLVMMIEPHGALGLSRGSLGLGGNAVTAPPAGICADAVAVHGYKCQEFEVATDDGYVLSVQRIPEGRVGGGSGKSKQPVLLQHGVLVDGRTWLLNSPDESLALILADSGYDVWIPNTRGTAFSRRHLTLDPQNPDFWNWTWDDLVSHDLTASIDFVFKQTGKKIDYVGHSLGTLIALASLSEGQLTDKVRSAALLSPIAYLSHMTTALGVVAAKAFVGEVTTLVGIAEFNPKGEAVANFLKILCAKPGVDCYDLITAVTAVRDGVVSKYDYGNADFNVEHYGEAKPPIYNMSNIPHDFPLFLSYGGQDSLSDIKDVQTLLDNLKLHDPDKLSVQFVKDYAHADFIMGVTAKDIVYNQILAFFKRQL